MKMIPFECPNCGAQLNVVEGKTHMKCGWCGGDIMLKPDGDSVKASLNINVNVNVDRDEARIREADVLERVESGKTSVELFKTKVKAFVSIGMLAGGIGTALICHFIGTTSAGLVQIAALFVAMYGFAAFMHSFTDNGNDRSKGR